MTSPAFNPSDPFDASADTLRRGVADCALEVFASPPFQTLPPDRQLTCMMAGLMTGVVGVMLSFVPKPMHDEFLTALAEYLPDARRNAYDISDNGQGSGLQ